jgi:general secretion pathway protein A
LQQRPVAQASISEEPLELQTETQEAPLNQEPPTHVEVALLEAPALPDTPFAFFGLTGDPFGAHPDARFFYPSLQHREALAVLSHRVSGHAGFMVLLGEPGTGKSIVLECLKDLLKESETHFAYLLNSRIGVAEFFELIAHDFRLPCSNPTKTATLIALNEYLLARSRAGQTTALVVDSAEKLSIEVLEEIELLGNLENREGRLLQVVFAAQPSFERLLDAPELRSLRQRLVSRARLEPLDPTQTAAYIEHRMMKAGARSQGVFPADVVAEIHRRTHGVPRLINALCGRLLASCRELQVKTAEVRMLEHTVDGSALPPKWESTLWTA